MFLLLLISLLNASATDLSPSLEQKFSQEQSDYEIARSQLLSHVELFNHDEAQLNLLKDTLTKIQFRDKLTAIYKKNKLSRATWETFFHTAWTKKDISDVQAWQQQLAEQNRLQAQKESRQLGIDLNSLRGQSEKANEFCKALPKGGMLHLHPYGTMDRSTVQDVLDIFNPTIVPEQLEKYIQSSSEKIHPRELSFLQEHSDFYSQGKTYRDVMTTYPQDAERLQDLFFMPQDESLYSANFTPFERFLAAFSAPLELLGVLSGNADVQIQLEKILYDRFFLRSLANGVYYVELTRNLPVLATSRDFSDRYQELIRWTDEMQNSGAHGAIIYPRTLLSFSRTPPDADDKIVQQVTNMSQILSAPPSPAVVGINLMGNEEGRPALESAQFIYGKLLTTAVNSKLESMSLQATIHAGELGDVRNLRDALIFGVQRIGHGIKLSENPIYLEMARRQHIAIESNLSSNEILKIVPIHKNPYVYFQRLGLNVSLSTDDEGIFKTDISNDCAQAIAQTDIEYTELKQMMINSLETSFADEGLKKQLLGRLKQDLADFEAARALK